MNNIKFVGIWDFDNFLFRNLKFNLSDNYISLERVVIKKELSHKYNINFDKFYYNILLTGRKESQSVLIKNVLKRGEYNFNSFIFYPINIKDNLDHFNWINYWKWKGDWILTFREIILKYNEYRLVIFDDDEVIREMCKKFKVKCVCINTTKEWNQYYCYNCFKQIINPITIKLPFRANNHALCYDCYEENKIEKGKKNE